MTESCHDRRREELAAYLLDALAPEEAAVLERHLARCERCREELRRLAPALQVLPEAVERVEPPPGLRRRLLAEVRADAGPANPRERGGRRGLTRPGGLRLGSLGRRPLAGLAALVLLLAVIAGYEIGSNGGGSSVTTFRSGHSPGVVAEVHREGTAGQLRLANVRQLPAGRVLEAWVRRGGTVEPVKALFVPDRQGEAATTLGDLSGVDLVMVTVEPAGGTRAPTTAPITSVRIE